MKRMKRMKMMKSMVFSLSIFVSSALFAGDDVNSTIAEQVQNTIQGTTISKVEKAEINGLYKAFMPNGDLLYIEPNQKLIFFGQIWTSTGMSLTQNDVGKWQQEIMNKKIETFAPEKFKEFALETKFNGGSERYEVVLFTDPECPYCKQVDEYLKTKKVTVFYNYTPIDELHPKAREKSLLLIAGKNMFKKKQEKGVPPTLDMTKAQGVLAKMEALAKELNIVGTPKLFIIDKKDNKIAKAINGANIPQIEQYLK